MTKSPPLKLSICIGTFNRAGFIGATLESIIAQATSECEIVISDNASTDATEIVVSEYARRFDRLRYIRHDTNRGFDRNIDCAVDSAHGEYCWLFSDDDLMKPNAVETVLKAISRDYCLVLVNGEHMDFSMSNVCVPNFFGLTANRVYASGESDRLFSDMGTCLVCVCCVVIKRQIWLARDRKRYYGSWWVYLGVMLQEPLPGETLVIAKPLMSLRLGNLQEHAKHKFKIWFINLPSLVWSFPLSESTKKRFCISEPWRRFRYLLAFRAGGVYSWAEYQDCVSAHLRSFRERAVPVLVLLLPRKLAGYLYAICSAIAGWPRVPEEVAWSMIPESWRGLQLPVDPPAQQR